MSASETKVCENCKASFVIDASDFAFYEKIQVPPPSWCPECRMVRRMVWRNERTLYKRACGLCGKDTISMYDPAGPGVSYCRECWHSDAWDVGAYARDYDWKRPFFEQWHSLLTDVPRFALHRIRNNVRCEFANWVVDSKDCYLAYSVVGCEEVRFSFAVDKDTECGDCMYLHDSQLCYESVDGASNYRSGYLVECHNCIDSWFLFDCVNCQNCFMSFNLRNKKYVFENVQYPREEYEEKIKGVARGSYAAFEELKERFRAEIRGRALHKFAAIINAPGSTGHFIENSKNAKFAFNVYGGENLKYVVRVAGNSKDSQDVYGIRNSELIYETVSPGYGGYANLFSVMNDAIKHARYSMACLECSNIFGCVGLRNKQYCILNKQYSKEEYESLVSKIIEHMNAMPYIDAKGRAYAYGEFFPPELSPFAYNESIAREYFPLTKEQALERGYRWKDSEERSYHVTRQLKDISDHIRDVSDAILEDVIGCAHRGTCNEQCTTAFKIIEPELQFYRRMDVPLPRLCPNCRHYERLRQRNPLKLWHRPCACAGERSEDGIHANTAPHSHGTSRCPNEFETSYAPERKEIVYCEQCYNAEVV